MLRRSRSQNLTQHAHEYSALMFILLLVHLGAAASAAAKEQLSIGASIDHQASTNLQNLTTMGKTADDIALMMGKTADDIALMTRVSKASGVHQHTKPTLPATAQAASQREGNKLMRRSNKASNIHQHFVPTPPAFAQAASQSEAKEGRGGGGSAETPDPAQPETHFDDPPDAQHDEPDPAKTDCEWGEWEEWGDCPVTCDGWTRHRLRHPQTEDYNGLECVGEASETEDCAPEECPPTTTVTYAPIEIDVPFWVVLYVYMIVFWPCTMIFMCMCCVMIYFCAKSGNKPPPPQHGYQGEGDPYGAPF